MFRTPCDHGNKQCASVWPYRTDLTWHRLVFCSNTFTKRIEKFYCSIFFNVTVVFRSPFYCGIIYFSVSQLALTKLILAQCIVHCLRHEDPYPQAWFLTILSNRLDFSAILPFNLLCAHEISIIFCISSSLKCQYITMFLRSIHFV